jgi:hypothetical protein
MHDKMRAVSYTEMLESKESSRGRKELGTLEADAGKTCVQTQTAGELSGNHDFSFEKVKVMGLGLNPNVLSDINDDHIQKLKLEIISKHKTAMASYTYLSTVLQFVSILLFLLTSLELIAIFFLMLHLMLITLPVEHLLLMIIPACGLQVLNGVTALKGAYFAPENNARIYGQLRCLCGCSVAVLVVVVVGLFCSLAFPFCSLTKGLNREHARFVNIVLTVYLVDATVKLMFHIACLCLIRALLDIASKINTRTDSTPTLSASAPAPASASAPA